MRQGSVVLKVTVMGCFLTTTSWASDQESAPPSVIRVMVRQNGRLLVPVAVNGKEESRFLFDTGATTSVLSEKLAAKACVTPNGVKRVSTFAGAVSLPVGQVDTMCIGDHSVVGIEVIVADLAGLFNLDAEIDGILGQDILSRFNYLIDRRHQKLEIEEGGNLSSNLSGNRITCEKRGGKIYVPAAGGRVRLMLDSGNPYLVIYDDAVSRFQATPNIKDEKEVRSSIGSRKIRSFTIDSLEIGDSIKRNVEGYLTTRSPGRSEDGFLPLSVFDSIYVSNLENFLIANPKRNRHEFSEFPHLPFDKKRRFAHFRRAATRTEPRERRTGGIIMKRTVGSPIGSSVLWAICAQPESQGLFLEVTVTDERGTPIPGAEIAAEGLSAWEGRPVYTQTEGRAVFTGLEKGRYRLRVSARRYESTEYADDLIASDRIGIVLRRTFETDQRSLVPTVSLADLAAPRKAQEEYRKGLIHLKKGRYEKGRRAFQAAVDAYPSYSAAYAGLGASLLQLGEREGALQAFQRALGLDDRSYYAQLFTGLILNDQKRYAEAYGYLSAAAGLRSNHSWQLYYELGRAHYGLDRLADAEKTLRQAQQAGPRYGSLYLLLANTLSLQQKYDEAIAELEEFLQVAPESVAAGEVRSKLGMLRAEVKRRQP